MFHSQQSKNDSTTSKHSTKSDLSSSKPKRPNFRRPILPGLRLPNSNKKRVPKLSYYNNAYNFPSKVDIKLKERGDVEINSNVKPILIEASSHYPPRCFTHADAPHLQPPAFYYLVPRPIHSQTANQPFPNFLNNRPHPPTQLFASGAYVPIQNRLPFPNFVRFWFFLICIINQGIF